MTGRWVPALVCASALTLPAQPADHRDRIDGGMVPVVITPSGTGTLELKLLDNGVAATGIVGTVRDVPMSLAVQVDIGRHVHVETPVATAGTWSRAHYDARRNGRWPAWDSGAAAAS